MSGPANIEKENLDAHVELCAIRYNNLEYKLSNLETRMDNLEKHVIDIKHKLSAEAKDSNKQTIGILMTILGIISAALLGFISNGIFK